MDLYTYTYIREQRATIAVEAESESEAEIKAENKIENLKLNSEDDESDDEGYLNLRQIENILKRYESKETK